MATISDAELASLLVGISNSASSSASNKTRITRARTKLKPVEVNKVSPTINNNSQVMFSSTKKNDSFSHKVVAPINLTKAVSVPNLNQVESVNSCNMTTDNIVFAQNINPTHISDPVVVLMPISPNTLASLQQANLTSTNLSKVNSFSYPIIPEVTQKTFSSHQFRTSVLKPKDKFKSLDLDRSSPIVHNTITLPTKEAATKTSINEGNGNIDVNKDIVTLQNPISMDSLTLKSTSFPEHSCKKQTFPVCHVDASNNITENKQIIHVNKDTDTSDLPQKDASVLSKKKTPVKKSTNKNVTINSDVKPVATLVFFDLETTGLGYQIGKHNVQITEISMIAIDRKQFWESQNDELKDVRVIHKLSMCVRPRSKISVGAAIVTGLDNCNLIDQCPFDENAATTIISFLSHLPKPVCLLAHNGNTFDFPLLKAELMRLNMELPNDILVADTLRAFKSVGISESPPDRKISKSVKYGKSGRLSHSLENLHVFFFGVAPPGGHTSEGDCAALSRVFHKVKRDVLPWVEANVKTFESIIPMW